MTFDQMAGTLEYMNNIRPQEKKREKRNWMARFQRWSDRMRDDPITSYGKCGYGTICDNCDGEMKGNPCARAYNDYVKERGIEPGYGILKNEDAWDGNMTPW